MSPHPYRKTGVAAAIESVEQNIRGCLFLSDFTVKRLGPDAGSLSLRLSTRADR